MQPEEEKITAPGASRTVHLAFGEPADKKEKLAGNNIRTAKYNVITFLPIFLFEMFSRVAYLYFLAQVGAAMSHRLSKAPGYCSLAKWGSCGRRLASDYSPMCFWRGL